MRQTHKLEASRNVKKQRTLTKLKSLSRDKIIHPLPDPLVPELRVTGPTQDYNQVSFPDIIAAIGAKSGTFVLSFLDLQLTIFKLSSKCPPSFAVSEKTQTFME